MRIHGRLMLGSALAAFAILPASDAQAGKPRPQPLPLSAYVQLDAVIGSIVGLADGSADPAEAVGDAITLTIAGKASVLASKLRISGELAAVQNGQLLASGSFDAVTAAAVEAKLDPAGGRTCVVLDGKVTDGRRIETLHKELCQDVPAMP